MKERIVELDFFKGVAMLLVVCGHFILNNWSGALDKHPVYIWIYSFHMPLFFFISGYLISYSGKELSFITVKKKVEALLIPFILWSFLLYPFLSNANVYFSLGDFFNPSPKYWFVYLLFFYSMAYYCCNEIYRRSYLWGVLIFVSFVILFVVGESFYHCELFSRGIQFYPIYIYGVLANKLELTKKGWLENTLFLSILFVLFVASSLCYCKMESSILNKVMKLVASFSICTIILYYIKIRAITEQYGSNHWWINQITYVGKNSIVIYLSHFLFVKFMQNPIDTINDIEPFWALFLSIIASIVIVGVCLLIGRIADNFLWINRFVFGRDW